MHTLMHANTHEHTQAHTCTHTQAHTRTHLYTHLKQNMGRKQISQDGEATFDTVLGASVRKGSGWGISTITPYTNSL